MPAATPSSGSAHRGSIIRLIAQPASVPPLARAGPTHLVVSHKTQLLA